MFLYLKDKITKVFKKQTKGCLYGKTEEQKKEFFIRLISFAKDDPMFFKEQYNDLLPHEQREFIEYIYVRRIHLVILKVMCNIFEKVIKDKYQKTNGNISNNIPEGQIRG
jgi:hypothetical protein